jgi:uncharacterized membrane protein YqhA
MRSLLSNSRYIILIPVLSSLLGALVLMIYGAWQTVIEVFNSFQLMSSGSSKGIKDESVAFIELVDVFLLATVLYIIAVGLYELFIGKLDLPEWLLITSLDDLKAKLISVIVTVLGVLFLGYVVKWKGEQDILWMGGAIALVIFALTLFARQTNGKKPKPSSTQVALSSDETS